MEMTLSTKPEIISKLDKQAEFIKLRARGLSLRQCGEALGTNKDTCNKWDKELKVQVAKHKAERLQDVYTEYGMYKEARIRALGTALNNIDTELSSRDLSDVPTDKLLDYKLKYTTALSEEYVPISSQTDEGQILDTKTIIDRLDSLYKRVRDGETTKEQAQTELVVLTGILRAYDSTELEDKVDKLRRAISV